MNLFSFHTSLFTPLLCTQHHINLSEYGCFKIHKMWTGDQNCLQNIKLQWSRFMTIWKHPSQDMRKILCALEAAISSVHWQAPCKVLCTGHDCYHRNITKYSEPKDDSMLLVWICSKRYINHSILTSIKCGSLYILHKSQFTCQV